MIVLGVDPGGATGLVLVDVTSEGATVLEHAQLEFDDACDWIAEHLHEAELLAVERFVISGRTITGSRQGTNDAINVIGVCRYLSRIHGITMRLQAPADAKAAFNDAVLKATNVYSGVGGRHARDALRHAMLAARIQTRLTD